MVAKWAYKLFGSSFHNNCMKNPINGINLFLVEYKGEKDLVSISYVGRNGMVRAFLGYGDTRLAYAGGGGYDKIGTCLDTAIQQLTGVELDGNGAAGV